VPELDLGRVPLPVHPQAAGMPVEKVICIWDHTSCPLQKEVLASDQVLAGQVGPELARACFPSKRPGPPELGQVDWGRVELERAVTGLAMEIIERPSLGPHGMTVETVICIWDHTSCPLQKEVLASDQVLAGQVGPDLARACFPTKRPGPPKMGQVDWNRVELESVTGEAMGIIERASLGPHQLGYRLPTGQ
jgi:hypothetical protein